jgi:hypothetical protein
MIHKGGFLENHQEAPFFEWMEGDGVVKGKRTYSKIKKGM